MLSFAVLKKADFSYYFKEEEHLKEESAARSWLYGGLARELGLPSEPTENLLFDLVRLRKSKRKGRVGLDLCFSAPKSVSLIYAVGDIDTKKKVLQAHEQAVKEVLEYIETNIETTRKGKKGEKQKGKLVFACFTHELSRANDPQLHTHALLLNVVKRDDGAYSAMEIMPITRRTKALGRMYREKLMQNLKELGFKVVLLNNQHTYFEIATVPEQLVDRFSQRDRQIKSYMKQGIPKKVAIYLNRTPKSEPNPELWNTKLVGVKKELFEEVLSLQGQYAKLLQETGRLSLEKELLQTEKRELEQRLKELRELREKQEREWQEQKKKLEEELEKIRRELESARREKERVWKEIEDRYIELVAELSLLEQELQKNKPRTPKELQGYWNRANEIKQEMDKLQKPTQAT